MLHHEAYRGSGFSATEAFVDTFRWGYGERWRLLVVERAASHIISASSLQRNEVADHIHNLSSVQYFSNSILRYHK